MKSFVRTALAGAAAGAAATLPMSGLMAVFDALGVMESQPPREITSRSLAKAGVSHDSTSPGHNALSGVAHLAFGAAAGAAFAPVEERLAAPPILSGVAWGTAVWAASYLGWLPALGLQPPPYRNAPRLLPMLMAHAVFGGVLGPTARALSEAWANLEWRSERTQRAR